mmetsp:Transcript_33459/g.81204  ORF Transcript_33459/g.81204 Transcript_33459/m.81204 type:complete len:384 (-) Transcript_33459:105-1256(-)
MRVLLIALVLASSSSSSAFSASSPVPSSPRQPERANGALNGARIRAHNSVFPAATSLEWQNARRRPNKLLFVRLRNPSLGTCVCVATYHLPCAFRMPAVLTLHAVYVSNWVHFLANGDPVVLAGDLNIKPTDLAYKLLTVPDPMAGPMPRSASFPRSVDNHRQSKEETHPHFSTACNIENSKGDWLSGDMSVDRAVSLNGVFGALQFAKRKPWGSGKEPQVKALLKSAYKSVNGKEPPYTTFSRIERRERFISTLDYILVSPYIHVRRVLPLPELDTQQGPLPTISEPSDHLMLAASLLVPFPSSKKMGGRAKKARLGIEKSTAKRVLTNPRAQSPSLNSGTRVVESNYGRVSAVSKANVKNTQQTADNSVHVVPFPSVPPPL